MLSAINLAKLSDQFSDSTASNTNEGVSSFYHRQHQRLTVYTSDKTTIYKMPKCTDKMLCYLRFCIFVGWFFFLPIKTDILKTAATNLFHLPFVDKDEYTIKEWHHMRSDCFSLFSDVCFSIRINGICVCFFRWTNNINDLCDFNRLVAVNVLIRIRISFHGILLIITSKHWKIS